MLSVNHYGKFQYRMCVLHIFIFYLVVKKHHNLLVKDLHEVDLEIAGNLEMNWDICQLVKILMPQPCQIEK